MSVSNLQGHVDNVTAQFNAGTVAKLDVLTSSVSLADAKTTAVTADNNVDVAEANLNNILGLPLQTKLELADHRLPFDSYDITLQQALDYAMKYRPDVLQAALAVQEAENSIGIAQAGNRPTVSVGAGNGWKDDDFPGTSNRNWSISGGISWSLWDGGSTNAKVKQAKLALLKAREMNKLYVNRDNFLSNRRTSICAVPIRKSCLRKPLLLRQKKPLRLPASVIRLVSASTWMSSMQNWISIKQGRIISRLCMITT